MAEKAFNTAESYITNSLPFGVGGLGMDVARTLLLDEELAHSAGLDVLSPL